MALEFMNVPFRNPQYEGSALKDLCREYNLVQLIAKPSASRYSGMIDFLADGVKLAVWRSANMLTSILWQRLRDLDEATVVLGDLCASVVDLVPQNRFGVMRVQVHAPGDARHVKAISHLFSNLNLTRTTFPGTELRLVYEVVR